MATRTVAAVDLGAESGRVMLARFDGRQLSLEEVHLFGASSFRTVYNGEPGVALS